MLAPALADSRKLERQLELLMSYNHDLVDQLADAHKAITCPTLLIWGENDPFFPVDKAREMVGQFSGPTRFEVVPKARLLVHEEHPKRVAELTRQFLFKHA